MCIGIYCRCCPPKGHHNSLFRSEEMTLCQLFLQSEASYSVIAELGELGLIQFKDLNPELSPFQRKFVNEVRTCDEMERILRFLEGELEKDKIKPNDVTELPEAPQPKEIRDLHVELGKLEGDMRDINANRRQLRTNYLELRELQIVLSASYNFLEEIGVVDMATFSGANINESYNKESQDIELAEKPAGPSNEYSSMKLNFITGVIPAERINGFERMLWFACRGNVYLRYAEITESLEDPISGDPVRKVVFCLFFQGEQLKQKAKKICEGFRASIYTIPKTAAEREEMSRGLAQRITDIELVLQKTDDHRHRLLMNASENIKSMGIKVLKTKAIYHTLNMFNMDVTQKCLIAECWCPVRDMDRIQHAIQTGTEKSGSEVQSVLNRLQTNETVPTFNRTNKFTKAFQSIVDAYGIGRYQEINPALFSIVTFPFIFAIMFGDCAHGIIMFGFALWMVLSERKFMAKKSSNEIWNIIFGGRYIVLLMGLFSIYTGFIYNDFFSKSANLFGSAWRADYKVDQPDEIPHLDFLRLNQANSTGQVYPMGLDPVWMISVNKITFVNSYKMKMSIIIGVIQMTFGLMLSLINHIFFRNWVNVFCEFIPEFIFIMAIFGYMVVLIVAKWVTRFHNTSCAPSILVGFINMFLFSYSEKPGCHEYILFNNLDTQKLVQTILVILAGICIPWLLICKPLVLGIQRVLHRKRSLPITTVTGNGESTSGFSHQQHVDATFSDIQVDNLAIVENGEGPAVAGGMQAHDTDEHEEEAFGEIIVHQCIHTIEYCLGCVSNTASYLRLWALSLAHAQLSEVLWNMVLKNGLSANDDFRGAPITIVVFPPFAVLTVCVLLLMEGLSAFLHALRLHWVEFNSKFFAGDGIKFVPFTFKHAVQGSVRTEAT